MIFYDYIKGDIRLNKKSYTSTILTIFFAVIILSTFTFGVVSYFDSFRDMIGEHTGGYHFRLISTINSQDAKDLVANRHVKKIGFFNKNRLNQSFGSKEETVLIKIDENALETVKFMLKDGQLPKPGEILISNYMEKEVDKTIGDELSLNGQSYKISGIYSDTGYDYEKHYNIFLNQNQQELLDSGEELSPFIWYKNVFKTYKISRKIMEDLDKPDLVYNFNSTYLGRCFVFDKEIDPAKDYPFQLLSIALFFILIFLFYSIITNLFVIQESKSIMEYAKLKAIGATSKDIRKIIRLKILYIAQIPIFLGILTSIGLIKLLFTLIQTVENYFGAKNIYSITNNLRISFHPILLLTLYTISFLVVFLGSKKPGKKLKKLSILDGLKGNMKNKLHKKYDLKYRNNIEKDLSKQFFKNSKKNFRATNISLKLGFTLMTFIMATVSFYNLSVKYDNIDKFNGYNIHCKYGTNKEIDRNLLDDIENLSKNDYINFRKEFIFLDYDEKLISPNYIEKIGNLEENLTSLDNLRIDMFGIDDHVFNKLVRARGLEPSKYKNNKVLLLNTMADDFNMAKSKMKFVEFLNKDINEVSVSEYGNSLGNRGYEFKLNVEDKIDTPLFDYPLREDRLNIYMPKSEYIKLLSKFARIADLDQFEYVLVDSNDISKTSEELNNISSKYFKEGDFNIVSQLEQKESIKKTKTLGNLLALFLSTFFIVIGLSNCYFSLYNLFLERKTYLLLYKSIGMDQNLLENILQREKNKLFLSLMATMPLILLGLSAFIAKSSKIFTIFDILVNINYIFLLGYIILVYLTISKIYKSQVKDIM